MCGPIAEGASICCSAWLPICDSLAAKATAARTACASPLEAQALRRAMPVWGLEDHILPPRGCSGFVARQWRACADC